MKRCLAVMLLTVMVLSVNSVFAQEFSSSIVTKTSEGTTTGKFFASKDRLRMDMAPAVTITRLDKKVVWMLLPDQNTFMEMPMEPSDFTPTLDKVPGEKKRTLLNTETIDGRETKKYEVVFDSRGKEETLYIWMSEELNFPIKSSAVDDSWVVEYKDISAGPQPAELFELPQGYKKFDYGKTPDEAKILDEVNASDEVKAPDEVTAPDETKTISEAKATEG